MASFVNIKYYDSDLDPIFNSIKGAVLSLKKSIKASKMSNSLILTFILSGISA